MSFARVGLFIAAALLLNLGCGDSSKSPAVSAPAPAAAVAPAKAQATQALEGDVLQSKAECRACRQQNCTDYEVPGNNIVKLCFNNPDPAYSRDCIAASNCMIKSKCGYTEEGPSDCYCGKHSAEECLKPGVADGPCMKEMMQASRETELGQFAVRYSDMDRPMAAAHFLHQCDRVYCPACRL